MHPTFKFDLTIKSNEREYVELCCELSINIKIYLYYGHWENVWQFSEEHNKSDESVYDFLF